MVGMPSMWPCATVMSFGQLPGARKRALLAKRWLPSVWLVQSSACIRMMAAAVSSLSLIYSKYGLVTSTAATHFGITTSLGSLPHALADALGSLTKTINSCNGCLSHDGMKRLSNPRPGS